jgi:hypothetical protein
VLNWSISRNHKEIWNFTKISVTPGVYVTRGDSVQMPLTSGPRGWPAASFWVSSDQNFLDTCLHEKGKAMAVEKVGRCWTHWPARHVARSVGCHLVCYRLSQVSGASPRPCKYPPPYWWKLTHTPHFEDSTYKAPILSVVARHSLVRRVPRLWEPMGLPAC